jgi:hypothetical protein
VPTATSGLSVATASRFPICDLRKRCGDAAAIEAVLG